MSPRFHHEALRRLGLEYAPDPAATRALAARASSLGIKLPASFVEWYGMRGGIELLPGRVEIIRERPRAGSIRAAREKFCPFDAILFERDGERAIRDGDPA